MREGFGFVNMQGKGDKPKRFIKHPQRLRGRGTSIVVTVPVDG